MQATLYLNDPLSRQSFERRASERVKIALPILISIGWTRYSALVHDLSSEGAMIETTAPLAVETIIEIQCGSIRTDGVVLWHGGNKFGIRFCGAITDRQVDEQAARSDAVASWRKSRAARSPNASPLK